MISKKTYILYKQVCVVLNCFAGSPTRNWNLNSVFRSFPYNSFVKIRWRHMYLRFVCSVLVTNTQWKKHSFLRKSEPNLNVRCIPGSSNQYHRKPSIPWWLSSLSPLKFEKQYHATYLILTQKPHEKTLWVNKEISKYFNTLRFRPLLLQHL